MRAELPPVCRLAAANSPLNRPTPRHRALAEMEDKLHCLVSGESLARLAPVLADPLLKLDEVSSFPLSPLSPFSFLRHFSSPPSTAIIPSSAPSRPRRVVSAAPAPARSRSQPSIQSCRHHFVRAALPTWTLPGCGGRLLGRRRFAGQLTRPRPREREWRATAAMMYRQPNSGRRRRRRSICLNGLPESPRSD